MTGRKVGIFIVKVMIIMLSLLMERLIYTDNVMLFVALIFIIISLKHCPSITGKWIQIVAFVLTSFCCMGNLEAYESFCENWPFALNKGVYIAICLTGGYWLWRMVLFYLFWGLDKLKVKRETSTVYKYKSLFAIWAIGGGIWFLWWLSFYPGIITSDSWDQLQQARGISPYWNWHPWFHTMIIKLFYTIGYHIGKSPNAGAATYTLFSMLFMSFLFSVSIWLLLKKGVKKRFVLGVFVVLFLTPYCAIYSITVWKDILFAGVILGFTCLIYVLGEKKKWTCMDKIIWGITGALVCLLRSNGLYVFVFCGVVLAAVWKEKRKTLILSSLVSIMIYVLVRFPIMSAFQVTQPPAIEALSIPLQQVAYTIYSDGKVEESELEILDRSMDTSRIAEEYRYHISNPVKWLIWRDGNPEYFENNLGEFLTVWLKIGLRNPESYIKAYCYQTRGYWYHRLGPYWKCRVTVYNEDDSGYMPKALLSDTVKHILTKWLEFYDQNIYSYFWSLGASDWCLIILLFYALHIKIKSWYICLPCIGVLLTLMLATPVTNEWRYAYGIFVTLPVIMFLILYDKDNCAECNTT